MHTLEQIVYDVRGGYDALKTILIASPIHQKPDVLQLFLQSLGRLIDTTPQTLSFYFIDDNTDAQSSKLLKAFQERWPRVTVESSGKKDDYGRDEFTHYWNNHLIWKVAYFKNKMIQKARDDGFDGLFLIDSDLLLAPTTISHLASQQVDIVSEVFWTQWQRDAMAQPQVWLRDEYVQWHAKRDEVLSEAEKHERMVAFYDKLRKPGLYEVGGLGACTLLSRKVIEGGVHFGEIPNLGFWGEDRHFCIRAAALGFTLYADTHFPPFHIYRESEIEKGKTFLLENSPKTDTIDVNEPPKLTLSMIVHNEEHRFLEDVLRSHATYIDEAVIIDDGSTDRTSALCKEILADIPLQLIHNEHSRFANEIDLRKQQWAETLRTNPDWILNMDADEMFEKGFANDVHQLIQEKDSDLISFRLYDMWDPLHYRDDEHWRAHHMFRPFLLRPNREYLYTWNETPQHCGRFPENIWSHPNRLSNWRVKHLGWSREEDRRQKYVRYQTLDPNGVYGQIAQYESILDPNPTLIPFYNVP
ncbi:glycosyltransferase [Bacillaceae bacterium SIJ1]|nr:glycosyltransferase [Litoribacterium kuwaitense]